jgi:hypothetical protein
LSKTPLRLEKLMFNIDRDEPNINSAQLKDVLSSIHPQMTVEQVEFYQFMTDMAIESEYVLQHLYAFRDLLRLTLDLGNQRHFSTLDLQHLFDQLNCPSLTSLTLRIKVNNFDWRVVPGDNLSSLQILQICFTFLLQDFRLKLGPELIRVEDMGVSEEID